MKKNIKIILLITVLVFFAIGGRAQDVVVLKHTNYTSHFSKSKKYPVMVEWWETKAKVACANPLPRKDAFQPDPQLVVETSIKEDYVGSGYDRGHMSPAASNQCQTAGVQIECFYMSNMAAQTHRLNAGDWKSLEVLTRDIASKQDSVRIWAGNVGEIKRIGRVAVPKQCWKVVYVKASNEWMAFIFENDLSNPDGINNNKVDLVDVEKLTGFKFK
jgi:endonuclease G